MLAHNSFVFHYGQVLLYIRPSVSQFKNGGGKSPGTVPLITFRHETMKIAPGFFKILSGMIPHEWDFC